MDNGQWAMDNGPVRPGPFPSLSQWMNAAQEFLINEENRVVVQRRPTQCRTCAPSQAHASGHALPHLASCSGGSVEDRHDAACCFADYCVFTVRFTEGNPDSDSRSSCVGGLPVKTAWMGGKKEEGAQ